MAEENRWQWSEQDAREALAKYDGVVRMLARRLHRAMAVGRAMDGDDLCAEGRVAVLEALRSYRGYGIDERVWVKTRIRQRMIDAIRRLDLRTREEFRLARRQQAGELLGEDEYEKGRVAAARRHVSMDASFGDAEPLGLRLRDSMIPSAEACADLSSQHEQLLCALERIPPRQRQAIELGVFEGMALREIGKRMGISESRVCQLQKRAVEHLRRAVREDGELSAA
ncbi:MAG: sigma-70 family RNA polymerase sigma factor [Polyangiales bacterium]|nr:sigma-70 family RNA polymerase sigma factor [Myxococcales bacterium]